MYRRSGINFLLFFVILTFQNCKGFQSEIAKTSNTISSSSTSPTSTSSTSNSTPENGNSANSIPVSNDRPAPGTQILPPTGLLSPGLNLPISPTPAPVPAPNVEPIVPTTAAIKIEKVFGRDGVAAVYFASTVTEANAIYGVKSSCSNQITLATKSPVRLVDLPLDQQCDFSVGLIKASGLSMLSEKSRSITMPARKYFGYYNYYHGFSDYPANLQTFNLATMSDHANIVMIHLNDPYYMDRIRQVKQNNMHAVIDIGNIFYQPDINPLVSTSVVYYLNKTKLSEKHRLDWNSLVQQLEPYRENIAAFYDEEAYWSAAYHQNQASEASIISAIATVNSNLSYIAATIKESFPEIPFAFKLAP